MPLSFPSASPSAFPEEVWTAAFEKLSQRIRRSFVRPEPHQHALAYVRGLMSLVERKNGWQVAEAVGAVTPYAMQHLLNRAKWDCNGVRDALRAYIVETLATPNAVLVVDETGFRKVWHPIGGRAATIQRHGWSHRELPGGRVLDLREYQGARAAGSRVVSTQKLDSRS